MASPRFYIVEHIASGVRSETGLVFGSRCHVVGMTGFKVRRYSDNDILLRFDNGLAV